MLLFHALRPGRGRATLPVCVAIVVAGLALIVAEHWYLRWRREDNVAGRAEQEVAARVGAAQEQMARRNWDGAIRLLEEAVAIEGAGPASAGARAILPEARRGQAEALFDSARAALAAKDAARGQRLLNEYIAHPGAVGAPEARALKAELHLALSDREAIRRLGTLSDDALTRFELDGDLPQALGGVAPLLRPLFRDTCRRHLAREMERRQARRARLRGASAFRNLLGFVARVELKQAEETALAQRQGKALEQLFVRLGVNDRAEQEKVRAALLERPGASKFAREVERKRAEAKRAFRASPERQAGDEDVFDRMVDEVLDRL